VWSFRITKDLILDMHIVLVERYGGRTGVRSSDVLDDILALPDQLFFGSARYTTPLHQTAAMVCAIIKREPFISQNDTTALLVLLHLCHHMGYEIDASHSELASVLKHIHRDADEEPFYAWLKAHVVPHADLPF
jgi:death-on-curing protein